MVWNPERHMGFVEEAFLQHVRDAVSLAASA
jgi:hypothetical protein